jgi:hypothetical protein
MDAFRQALAARLDSPPFLLPPVRHVRGIVIPAGGNLYNRLAWHLVHALRRLGCKLPIQIWHLPAEADITWRQLFEDEGCEVIDAGIVAGNLGVPVPMGGWQLKPFSLRHCDMAEAMLLDADNVPVRDPSYLFADPGYERHGAMFWPDLAPPRSRGQWVPVAAWRNVGLEQDKAARPFESGQIVVNRRRSLAALDVTCLLNEWSDYVYQWVYGDKDTFLLAWHFCGQRYHMPPRNPVFREPAICQHDGKGELVFQHATAGKHAIARGDVLPGLINRRFAPDAAADLRRKMAKLRAEVASQKLTPQVETNVAPEATA